ncbi:MAG: DUF547 domain-containing protein [bacterium]
MKYLFKIKPPVSVAALLLVQMVFAGGDSEIAKKLSQADGPIQPDHRLFTEVLQDHVKAGVVDYQAIKADPRFENYIESLRQTDPYQIRSEDFLSFWINVYNAFTIKIVCDNYPLKSLTDLHTGGFIISHIIKKTVWDKKYVELNGQKYTLNFIEHKLLRPIGDARVHFALVCAARSCPPLRSEAFESSRLDAQLNDQGRIFMSQTDKNRFDFANKVIYLSKIFDWFSEDFEKNGQSLLQFLTPFLSSEQTAFLEKYRYDVKIKHTDYDWRLNRKNELTF